MWDCFTENAGGKKVYFGAMSNLRDLVITKINMSKVYYGKQQQEANQHRYFS